MRFYLAKYLLKHLLKNKCGASVPRTGEEAEAVNCYYVYLFRDERPYIIVTQIQENALAGKLWENRENEEIITIDGNDLKNYKIFITHYNGIYKTSYRGLFSYFLTGFTKIDQLKCTYYKWSNITQKFIFNRRALATFDRIEILRALIEMKLTNNAEEFMTMDLIRKLEEEK